MSLIGKAVRTIGTHNGVFHCDEALGCALLKVLLPEADIIRSRDSAVLDKCDLVLDVGAVYNPETLRFDHHQKTFNETFGSCLNVDKFTKVRLSSAGLIYCHFGKDVIKKLGPDADAKLIDKIFIKVYENFIQEIDGIDNGIPMFEGEPLYYMTTGLSARVGRLNPQWNTPKLTEEETFELFKQAMDLAFNEFKENVHYFSNIWWPARKIVLTAVEKRFEVHPSGKIMYLETVCPWKSHFFEIEEELNIVGEMKFVIFKDDSYRVQAVSLTEKSFVLRTPLLESWRGLRDEELSKVSDIPECIFVHSSGFIGGNKSKEGAMLMAKKTLEQTETNGGF